MIQATIGLAAGLALGLLYSWVISPVQYVDTAPSSLRADYQAAYVELVARAYAVDGNLGRARTRLGLLGPSDPARRVTTAAQRATTTGSSTASRSLADLAAALGGTPANTPSATLTASSAATSPTETQSGSPTALPSASMTPSETPSASPTALPSASATPSATPSASPTPTKTPLPTDTVVPSITPRLLPTRTPTPTPLVAFRFMGQQEVCDARLGQPLIQVITQAADGKQIPGVEVVVTWDEGFDHFFTGLKPDLGRGYGDFTMTPGTVYAVHLAESPSLTIDGLTPGTCYGPAGSQFPGSWLLVFRQP